VYRGEDADAHGLVYLRHLADLRGVADDDLDPRVAQADVGRRDGHVGLVSSRRSRAPCCLSIEVR